MKLVKSYDICEMALDGYAEEFHKNISPEFKQKLKAFCELIDTLAEEFNGESCIAGVDMQTGDLIVTLQCPDIVLEDGCSHYFFDLIKSVSKFSFSASGDFLDMKFRFGGAWQDGKA